MFELALENQGPERTAQLLEKLAERLRAASPDTGRGFNTPYVNTIPADQQAPFPGDRDIERRIKSYIRWNAMAMVVKANSTTNVGGHISTYASAATIYEVAFNHFFRGRTENFPGDMVYFQGHAAPGIYARAFLEGRLEEKHLQHFRQELAEGGGLSSYPHPYLMPDFWQFPTVSMGLGPDPVDLPGAVQPLPAGARPDANGRKNPRSGRSSATANRTNRKRSAPSRSPRARTSTI